MGIVRRQATYSGMITIVGFVIGAINILIIFPQFMSKEQLGLTRLIMEAGMMIAALCSFGVTSISNKFFPYYRHHIPDKKNDLAGLSLLICLAGFLIFLFIAFFFKDLVIRKFGGKSPLFAPYYYLLIPFTFFYLLFMWLETFAWGYKKAVLTNAMKETFLRLYTTALLGLLAVGVIQFDGFMIGFSLSFALPVVLIWIILKKQNDFGLSFTPSKLTRRFKKPFKSFFGYAIAGTALGMLIKTMDTFFLAGFAKDGLGDVAIFTIATYITMVMDIPFRSIIATATPVLSESWKNKDMKNIIHIYSKSTLNLLIAGFFLFGCIWINMHNLPHIFPPQYKIASALILVMAITKLIDLGTGLNAHVIATSNFWKFEFYTTIVVSVFALFINGYLIKNLGLMGAAYGTLITLCVHNLTRFIFLWVKFGLQPFTWKNLLLLVVAAGCVFLFSYLPVMDNWILDGIFRCVIFAIVYIGLIWILNISDDLKILTRAVLRKIRLIN